MNQFLSDSSLSDRQKLLLQLMQSERPNSSPRISPRGHSGPAPLSLAQQRLWFIGQIEAQAAPNNILIALRITGALDRAAIRKSLSKLVERHEVLRTNVTTVQSEPVQIISPVQAFPLPVVDLSRINDREAATLAISRHEIKHAFNLETEPLFHGYLICSGNTNVLLLTLHHIIADGWSIGILVHELITLYNSFVHGKNSPLAALSIQYADFAEWQRKNIAHLALNEHLEYWKKKLANLPEVIELPLDRPRPPIRTFHSKRQSIVLPEKFRTSLNEISRQRGVTSFMVLLAAFNVLLHRYTGQTDIVVGTDVANRNLPETECLIGFFVNQLVLRIAISGTPTFDELLRQVQNSCLEAYAAQDVPFDAVVEALKPRRSLQHSLLFQVKLVFQNSPAPASKAADLKFFPMEIDPETLNLDLFVNILKTRDGIHISLDYNTDIFNPATATRILEHFRNVLMAAVEFPDQRVSELQLLSEHERKQIVTDWNQTALEFPRDSCLAELLERTCKAMPDAIALSSEEVQLSYSELNSSANRFGNYLKKLGVRPEVAVGICLPRSVGFVITILGVLKAGGAYLPLDPELPTERLAFMIENAGALIVITNEAIRATLPNYGVLFISLENEEAAIRVEDSSDYQAQVLPENLAYMVYTSGSTGVPKAVMVTHRSVCNLAQTQKILFGMDSESRVLQFASWSFDASVSELWTTILAGGCLCLASRQELQDSAELQNIMHREQITTVTMPPSLLLAWKGNVPSLRTLVVAGEACSQEVASHWAQGRRFINAYGPTETTVCVSLEQSTTGECPGIGRPIGNVQAYVLDQYLEPVPVGVIGELFVGGAGVTRGYAGQPGITAQRFVPDPFSNESGSRIYRTGDSVRLKENGLLEFIGRNDDQVKIRGYRIEPGEIEAALVMHPAIEQAAIIATEAEGAERKLIAYIVPSNQAVPDSLQLREFLLQRLPDYMVPAAWIELKEMPLSANGKVDRKRLRGVTASHLKTPKIYEPPQSAVEMVLAEIWSELLSVTPIGIRDNFFDLGGHSLLGTLLTSRIGDLLAVELSLRNIFETPILQDLAARIERDLVSDDALNGEEQDSNAPLDRIAEIR